MTEKDKHLLWRSLDEKPKFPKNLDEPVCSILVLYDNGNMFLYRYMMDGRPIEVGVPHFHLIENAKWCYCDDLIPKKEHMDNQKYGDLPYGTLMRSIDVEVSYCPECGEMIQRSFPESYTLPDGSKGVKDWCPNCGTDFYAREV